MTCSNWVRKPPTLNFYGCKDSFLCFKIFLSKIRWKKIYINKCPFMRQKRQKLRPELLAVVPVYMLRHVFCALCVGQYLHATFAVFVLFVIITGHRHVCYLCFTTCLLLHACKVRPQYIASAMFKMCVMIHVTSQMTWTPWVLSHIFIGFQLSHSAYLHPS